MNSTQPTITLGDLAPTPADVAAVATGAADVAFTDAYRERVRRCAERLEDLHARGVTIYGVTTGFGDNVTESIAVQDSRLLQRNIVQSHAVSVGEPLPSEVVRATMLRMLSSLGAGVSGIRLETLELIKDLLNEGITPWAPGTGSVGYLAVEAHMARVLIGEGHVLTEDGGRRPAAEVLDRHGLEPVVLSTKEGLCLTNGTHSVGGQAGLVADVAQRLVETADIVSAMSFEALRGTTRSLDGRLHAQKKHPEQAEVAARLRRMLEGSETAEANVDHRVQDAYALRAIAQIHGGARRAVEDAVEVVEEEWGSVGDNPVLVDGAGGELEAIMGANFDSTFTGLACDSVVNAATVLAKASERRTDRMVNAAFSELPAFLTSAPGLNNGFMIAQYTAAALYMEMKAAAYPATVDNVTTSGNQEDVVSNAYLAARKASRALDKLAHVLAIELMCAAQARDLLDTGGSAATDSVQRTVREAVAFASEDRYFGDDMQRLYELVVSGAFQEVPEPGGATEPRR